MTEKIYGNTKNPKYIMLLLHGYGSNADDLISLAPEFTLADTIFIAPNAPHRCEQAFWSSESYQWFSLVDYDLRRILKEVDEAMESLSKLVASLLKKYNLPYSKLIMSGFSQGAMMSIHFALNCDEEILGVVAYSGRLLTNITKAEKITNNFALIHGKDDKVVPFKCLQEAEHGLKEIGKNPKTLAINNLPHSINAEGIDFSNKFLKQITK